MSTLSVAEGVAKRNPLCGTDWGRLLEDEFAKPYWDELLAFVSDERSRHPVYPPANEVFRALELTWCEQTKVVIVGQDPYHGPGQAHGLCFSVPCGVKRPSSLVNIHKELQADRGIERPDHGSLEPWAHRGVLLLNTTLTVRGGRPGCHLGRGWERFTDAVIRVVTEKSDPVFLLWGEKAQEKEKHITHRFPRQDHQVVPPLADFRQPTLQRQPTVHRQQAVRQCERSAPRIEEWRDRLELDPVNCRWIAVTFC